MNTVISITASTVKIDSFYKYSMAMLQSMFDNSGLVDIPIIFHYDSMTEDQRTKLKIINPNIIEFRKIPTETYKKYKKNSAGWFVLEGWNIKNYDTVIILDSDFICMGDLNYLTMLDAEISMCKEKSGIYNAGLVVASKRLLDEGWYEAMLTCNPDDVSIGGNRDKFSKDQKLINAWLGDRINEIDEKYNCLVGTENDICSNMIHYIYKPLYASGRRQLMNIDPQLVKLWELYYNKADRRIK